MKSKALIVSENDRETLKSLLRRPGTPRALALRARIILACCEGRTHRAVAWDLGVSLHTVGKWRLRYEQLGLEGLKDQPRSGKPRLFPPDELEALIRRTLKTPRPGGQRWSVRSVARVLGISPATIGRAWRELRLRQNGSAPASDGPPRGSTADEGRETLASFLAAAPAPGSRH